MDATVKDRYTAMYISLAVHIALLLLLFFLVMETKIPPFGGGGGVLVNIGYVDLASGDVQPISDNVTEEPQPVKEKVSSTPQPEKILTQETEEAPAVVTPKKAEPKKTEPKKTTPVVTETKTPVKEAPKVDQRAIYKGKSNGSSSQGTASSGTGDQGNPEGDPNSKYYGPNGSGTGPSTGPGSTIGPPGPSSTMGFQLTNRSIVRRPTLHDTSQETGKVVVEIVVDKSGNVTSTAIDRGTTTSSTHLQQLALKAARETKFSASTKGQEIQRGTITFVFVVQ